VTDLESKLLTLKVENLFATISANSSHFLMARPVSFASRKRFSSFAGLTDKELHHRAKGTVLESSDPDRRMCNFTGKGLSDRRYSRVDVVLKPHPPNDCSGIY
jgi:hypothetical protein